MTLYQNQTLVHNQQGGVRTVVASGGELDVQSGAEIDIENGGALKIAGTAIAASAAELNVLDGAPASATTLTVGTEGGGGTTINVAIQLKNANSVDLAVRGSVLAYLSNDANGDAIATSAPSGGWAIGTDGLLIPVVTNKAAQLVSEADGDIDITLTEAGVATWYLILVLPNGLLKASLAITFA